MMDLEEWLDETVRLRKKGDYFNDYLGTPKYDNGLDRLFPKFTPQEALNWWRDYQSMQGWPE